MKKIYLLTLVVLLMVSCQKDDEMFVPQDDPAQNIELQNLTDTSVTLQWRDMNAMYYTVEYGISGFTKGEGLMATTTIPSITLTNLIDDTTYDYYVLAYISSNGSTVVRSIRRFTTMAAPVVYNLMPNLSQMKIFRGTLSNLTPSPYAFEYDLSTRLYTDYAHKQRLIAMPLGTSMVSNGDGLPTFPDNTVIAKTFYYNFDDRNLALGRNLIETRLMIKRNGIWEFGNYVWNESQTDATLDVDGGVTPVTFIDTEGLTHNINYKIPNEENCMTCHQSYGEIVPIGPKLRSMNFDIEGVNQIQRMIANGELTNLADASTISSMPSWEDTNFTDEDRVRAYFDMNCAHCHSPGGFYTENYYDSINLNYETSFQDSHIYNRRYEILTRIQSSIVDYSMPYIGVSTPHQEALDLIVPFLESLE